MSGKSQWFSMALVLLACSAIQAADDAKPEAKPDVIPVVLAVGDLVPDFESIDEQGLPWKSADHVGKKVVVQYFYPGDFTGGCIKQAEAYREGLAKLEDLGVELVGVSGDEAGSHKLFKETYALKHALLADTEGKLGKLLGVPAGGPGRGQAMTPGPNRKPILDAEGKRILIQRSVTLERWTMVIGRDGKMASLRKIVNPVTDSEEVRKIVAALPM